jgi:hypothetical protein
MNAGLVHSELNFNFRLFCKTVSKSANWGFDRFRLFHSKWHTKIQVRRPDGSIVATQDFAAVNGFEHTFSFDLSENVNNEEYSVYVAGVTASDKFNQAYAYPTGYSATYGKNAEITFWDFSQVNVEFSGTTGRVRFENNPLTSVNFNQVNGEILLDCAEVNFTNCQLGAEDLADALIALDNSGITGGSFKYSGNNEAPAERALAAYNNLKDNKGWALTGEVPSDYTYLLDEVPDTGNEGVFIDFFKLSSTYSGPCIRVRRDSDNLEQDIGFNENYIDKTAITNFVGTSNGFIVKRYNQNGSGFDMKNPIASSQPRIVNAGILNDDNGFVFAEYATGSNIVLFTDDLNGKISSSTSFHLFKTNQSTRGALMAGNSSAGIYLGFFESGSLSGAEANSGDISYYKNSQLISPKSRGDLWNSFITNTNNLVSVLNAALGSWSAIYDDYNNNGVESPNKKFGMFLYGINRDSERVEIETIIKNNYGIL